MSSNASSPIISAASSVASSPAGSRAGSPVHFRSTPPSPVARPSSSQVEVEPVAKWPAPLVRKFLASWVGYIAAKRSKKATKKAVVQLPSIRQDLSVVTKLLLDMTRSGFVLQNQGFKMLAGFQPTKPVAAKAKTAPKAAKPKTPKTPVDSYMCCATSWNNPNDSWEAHDLATQGKIPYDRKPCGKKGTIEFKDANGDTIWMCATHAKSSSGPCARCTKCKDVEDEVTHKVNYLQIGYFAANGEYVDGECESLKCEGTKKLAKHGMKSRMAEID